MSLNKKPSVRIEIEEWEERHRTTLVAKVITEQGHPESRDVTVFQRIMGVGYHGREDLERQKEVLLKRLLQNLEDFQDIIGSLRWKMKYGDMPEVTIKKMKKEQ